MVFSLQITQNRSSYNSFEEKKNPNSSVVLNNKLSAILIQKAQLRC